MRARLKACKECESRRIHKQLWCWLMSSDSNNCDGFVVMEPRGRTRADEVAWPSSLYSASMLLVFAVAEMKMCEAHFESLLSTVVPLRKVNRHARPRLPCAMAISKHWSSALHRRRPITTSPTIVPRIHHDYRRGLHLC